MVRLGLILLCASSSASAEPSAYLGGGVMFGSAKPVVGVNLLASVTGGARVAGALWLRGLASYGLAVDFDQGGGTSSQLRAGVELRMCPITGKSPVCAVTAFDIGVQHGRWDAQDIDVPSDYETITAVVAVPAIAFELGEQTRWRVGFELDYNLGSTQGHLLGAPMAKAGDVIGGELTLGVTRAW